MIILRAVNCCVRVISGLRVMLACLAGLTFAAPSASLCARHMQTIPQVLSTHGWFVNLRELRLCPSQSFQCLGLRWNLTRFQCNLTDLIQVRVHRWVDSPRRQTLTLRGKEGVDQDTTPVPGLPVSASTLVPPLPLGVPSRCLGTALRS